MQRQKCSGAQLVWAAEQEHACATAASLIISAYIWVLLGAVHQASVQACALHTWVDTRLMSMKLPTHSHMTHTQLCSWGLHSPMVVWPVFCCATWSHMHHGRNIGNKFTCFHVYLLLGWPLRLKPLFPFSIFTRQACCRMCYVDGFARAIEVLTESNHYQASVLASLLQEK